MPDELLNLPLDVVLAVFRGYEDRLRDQQILSIQSGYYAGYYSRVKKPQPLSSVIKRLLKPQSNHKKPSAGMGPDIARFEEMEKRLKGG